MKVLEEKIRRKLRRKKHIRKTITGTPERPRLAVFRSNKHFYAQIINDEEMKTIVSASSNDKDVRDKVKPEMTKKELSKVIGEEIAKKAIEANIKQVAFDRSGYLYHGRIKEFADAARKAGLDF